MRIPTWRLVLTGAAVTILAVAGLGLASAADRGPATAADLDAGVVASIDGPVGPDADEGVLDGRLGRKLARHVIHAEITMDHPELGIITIALDRGTIRAIGAASLTIAEADGRTVVIKTDDETRVRVGRERGSLDDLAVGDEILVRSRLDGGMTLAKLVIEIPATAE